jgi:hypothetical protein
MEDEGDAGDDKATAKRANEARTGMGIGHGSSHASWRVRAKVTTMPTKPGRTDKEETPSGGSSLSPTPTRRVQPRPPLRDLDRLDRDLVRGRVLASPAAGPWMPVPLQGHSLEGVPAASAKLR